MIRYWFKFNFSDYESEIPPGLFYGCGVTSYDYNHAISILREKVFRDQVFPHISECTENIDISTLDQGKIIPNMKVPIVIGVWFPIGYD